MTGDSDHGRIIRAIFEGRDKRPPAFPYPHLLKGGPQPAVSRNASGDTEVPDTGLPGGLPVLVYQDGDDTPSHGGANTGEVCRHKPGILRRLVLQEIKHGRLQPAKAEVEPRDLWFGKNKAIRVSGF